MFHIRPIGWSPHHVARAASIYEAWKSIEIEESPPRPARFDRNVIGRYGESHRQAIESAQVAAYASAIDARPSSDGLCPPLFVVVPAWKAAWNAMKRFDSALGTDGDTGLGLHESQEMVVHRRLRIGEVVESRSKILGMRLTPLGTKALVTTETFDATGHPVAVQYSTTFFPGERGKEEVGSMSAAAFPERPKPRGGAVTTCTTTLSPDVASLYATASNDSTRLHVDEHAARDLGMSGTLVHGMCLLAIACEQLRDAMGFAQSDYVSQLRVRFARPAHPGNTLTTTFVASDDPRAQSFDMTDNDGTTILRKGYMRIAT